MANVELTDARIVELMAGSRQRGIYREALGTFVESENKGEQVDLESGPFAGKSISSVYQSMAGNAKEHYPTVRVIKNEDGVFLINTDLV